MHIEGVVVNDQDLPLSGVKVLVRGANSAVLAEGGTDAQGRFQLSAAGAVSLLLLPPGWGEDAGSVSLLPHVYRIEGTPRPQSIDATIRLSRAVSLPLLAYDGEGQKIEGRTEEARRFLNPTHVSFYDLDDMPQNGALHWTERDDSPTLLVPPDSPFVLRILWTAPGYGRLICTADNGGRGFVATGDAEPLFLNVALAESAWRRLQHEYARCREWGYPLSDEFHDLKRAAEEGMRAMRGQEEPAKMAALADRALGASLLAGERLVVERSRQRIARLRQRPLSVVVKDRAGRAVQHARLKYRQREHAFRFGLFINPHSHPITRVPLDASPLWERVKEMGINQLPMAILWPRVEPERGKIRPELEYDLWPAHKLRAAGFTLKSHVSVWFWHGGQYPDQWGAFVPMWAYDLSLEEIKRAVYDLTKSLIAKYYPHVGGWQAINEAMLQHTNAFNLNLDEHVEVVAEVVRAIREYAPDAPIEVNNCQVFGEGINPTVVEQGYERVPDRFYKALQERGVDFDVVGMQLYYGGYMYSDFWRGGFPIRHPWDLEAIIERYARLGKPINVSEVSVPSSHPLPEWGVDFGFWHGPWDPQRQADWVELFYTLCYSIPQVQEITWWNPTDEGAFIKDGGLLYDDYTPKPAAKRLAELTSGWLAEGETDVADGRATIVGAAGLYDIEVSVDGETIGTASLQLDPHRKGRVEVRLSH